MPLESTHLKASFHPAPYPNLKREERKEKTHKEESEDRCLKRTGQGKGKSQVRQKLSPAELCSLHYQPHSTFSYSKGEGIEREKEGEKKERESERECLIIPKKIQCKCYIIFENIFFWSSLLI